MKEAGSPKLFHSGGWAVDLGEQVIKVGPAETEFAAGKALGVECFCLNPAVYCESFDSQVFAGGGCVKPWIVIRIRVGDWGVRFHVGVALSSGPSIISNIVECTERGGNHCIMHNSLGQPPPRCTKTVWSGLCDAQSKVPAASRCRACPGSGESDADRGKTP